MAIKKYYVILLFTCYWILSVGTVYSEPIDSGTYWLMYDATPNSDANRLFNRFGKLLSEHGKVPHNNIQHIVGDQATKDELQSYLIEIGDSNNKIDTFIFFYHGTVSIPTNMNSMFFSTQSEESIQDTTLNRWLKLTGAKRTIVIIDGYAENNNLAVFYGNREIIGTSALNLIQPSDAVGKNVLLNSLIDVLSDEKIDTDINRNISILELHSQLQIESTFEQSIFVPTGNVDETVMKLNPAIRVTSLPKGAQIILNEKEVGLTPQLFTEDLLPGTYTVSIKKAGYQIPPSQSGELMLTQGEILDFVLNLEPISLFGAVHAPSDVSVVGTKVSIDGTEYVVSVGEDGTYTFQDWDSSKMLTSGKEYTLDAKQGDFYHGSTTFTFDGYVSIEKPIKLIKKTWFEIAELEFSRNNHQKAVNAFQNGIEESPEFPTLSEDLIVLLFTTFADAVDKGQFTDVKYIVVTAKLAEAYQEPELVKKYWKLVKLNAEKGSDVAKLAGQRLWQLNPWRNIVNIGIVSLLFILIISGIWTYSRYRKSKRTEVEVDA